MSAAALDEAEADRPEPDRLEGCPHPRETPRLHGQDAAAAAYLAAAAAGRLHHAWLLTGPRGTGKATLAWAIARHLAAGGTAPTLATAPEDPVFRRAAARAEPAIALVRRGWDPDAKRLRTQLTVDEIRGLRRHFALSAADGGWRVAIIDAADEMNAHAANALLKILEEPPDRALLLLVCHRPSALLPTIRSRCRRLDLAPLGRADLAAALRDLGREMPSDPLLPALSGGSVGEAVRLIDGEGLPLYRRLLALLAAMPGADRGEMIALADASAGRGAEATYDLTLRLAALALGRLVRAGAGAAPPDLDGEEAEAARRLVPSLAAARAWAGEIAALDARTRHARAVNLDPAQVVLDLLTTLDRHARRLARP